MTEVNLKGLHLTVAGGRGEGVVVAGPDPCGFWLIELDTPGKGHNAHTLNSHQLAYTIPPEKMDYRHYWAPAYEIMRGNKVLGNKIVDEALQELNP